jgi:hypothetical protein
MLIIKIIILNFKKITKKKNYFLKHFKVIKLLVVVKDESFVLKSSLLITREIMMFTIYLIRFQQHYLGLDVLLNKIF